MRKLCSFVLLVLLVRGGLYAAPAPRRAAVVKVPIASVHSKPAPRAEVVTQIPMGDGVQVLETSGPWARVLVTNQYRLAEGYPGWVLREQLANEEPASATVIVRVTKAMLRSAPDSKAGVESWAYLGTRLRSSGKSQGDWLSIALPGSDKTAWIERGQITAHTLPLESGKEILDTARTFMGTHYLWGGLSVDGIDCSGIVFMVYRLYGISLPRDADQQAAMGVKVDRERLQPGDLVFFGRDAANITHVGIYAGNSKMLEASGDGGGVCVSLVSHRRDYQWARRVIRVPLSMPPPSP